MFIERLLNQGSAPVLDATARFTSARHRLILENLANVDTPGYRQKDLSVERFTSMLHQRLDARQRSSPGSVSFNDLSTAVDRPNAFLFLDGNNRTMEQLTTDLARNALIHNLAVELLRKQFAGMELALKERVA